MNDPWETRIKLNPSAPTTKDAQVPMPGATTGTVGGGINDTTSDQSASSTDISNSFKSMPAPANEPGHWGGIDNQF